MTRVRFRDEWFYLISDNALFETELEKLIIQNADLLREGSWVLPFKTTVTAPGLEPRQPDLALIDSSYRYWWVIEVELVGHSLHGHVIPQIRTFVEGIYGEPHLVALLKQSTDLDPKKLHAMMLGEPPAVVVISNRLDRRWQDSLSKWGASFVALNVFRSDKNRDIFVLDGDLPDSPLDCLTQLSPTKIDRMFRVHSPAPLREHGSRSVTILVNDQATIWTIMPTSTDCFAFSPLEVELVPNRSYGIYETEDGKLSLGEWRQ
jgi:hypothetical protein